MRSEKYSRLENRPKMKFVIFGSTGPSGLQLVEECLQQGHCVTALVRNPDKMSVKHENLTVSSIYGTVGALSVGYS